MPGRWPCGGTRPPALILLLNQRMRKLTYPKWSLAQLRQVRIPTPDNPGWNALADAWEKVPDVEFLPIQEAERCQARRVIDEAAAAALDVSTETVAGWRAMLAAEPMVTNRRAGVGGVGRAEAAGASPPPAVLTTTGSRPTEPRCLPATGWHGEAD